MLTHPPPTLGRPERTVAASDVLVVRMSLGRCKLHERFSERFYEIFLASDARVSEMFARATPERRLGFLRHAVNLAMLYVSGQPAGQMGLRRVQQSHGPGGLQLDQRFYDLWTDSLVKAISESDPGFDAELEAAWRRVMKVAVDYLLAQ